MRNRSLRLISLLAFAMLHTSACGSSPGARQTRWQQRKAQTLMPARLQPPARYEREVRTARVRVYAGHQYRAQNLRWAERVQARIDAANQFLVPAFGTRLEVVEIKEWQQQTAGDDLNPLLDELVALDPAEDVDWVIGLASAISASTTSFHRLGVARPLSRHMILRGYTDVEDREVIEPMLDRLSAAAREHLLAARRQHLLTTVLLHEWAHTLAVMHLTTPGTMMSRNYARSISGFAPQSEDLIRTMLTARLGPPDGSGEGTAQSTAHSTAEGSLAAEVLALRRYLEEHAPDGWVAAERAEIEQLLAAAAAHEAPGQAAESRAARGVPAEAEAQLGRVRSLARQGHTDQAVAELDDLLAAYPAHTAFRRAACELWLAKEGASETATGHCLRVSALDPADPAGELILAGFHAGAGDVARAGEVLEQVRARIPTLAQGQEQAWRALVAMYQRMNAVTWAEQAVAVAPAGVDAGEEVAWAQELRRRYGLPPNGKRHRIAPADEGAYVQTVRGVLDLVYAGKYDAAQAAAREALRRYPGAPGVYGALCDLWLRKGRYAEARGQCRRAVVAYDEASWPHYLLGIVELRYRRTAAGIRHLERAIALDPDLRQAYHALGKALARKQDAAARERLDQTYRARFDVPLPR